MEKQKGFKELKLGPTGLTVANNIRELRAKRGLTISDLEKRLEKIGHKIHSLGLRRIEANARRVDVDDLTALAAVFGVSPLLLMEHVPPTNNDEHGTTGLPEDFTVEEASAWLRGNLKTDAASRITYWETQVEIRQRALAQAEDEQEKAAHDFMSNPGSSDLKTRQYELLGITLMVDKELAEATKMLNYLKTQH